MKIRFPKINWEKTGAYALGALGGGGLAALAWHLAEKHGIDPGKIFHKKVLQGNITYYDPDKDPNLDDDWVDDDLSIDDEDEDLDEGDYEDDGGTDGINEEYEAEIEQPPAGSASAESTGEVAVISRIDNETWYRSEENEGYKHAMLKYWIDDQQISDDDDRLIRKPWLLIGTDNYDELTDDNCDGEIFVRNATTRTDYCITRVEGSFGG